MLNYISKADLEADIMKMKKEFDEQFGELLNTIQKGFEGPQPIDCAGVSAANETKPLIDTDSKKEKSSTGTAEGYVYKHFGQQSIIFTTYEDCEITMRLHSNHLKEKYEIHTFTAMKAIENWLSFLSRLNDTSTSAR